MTLLTKPKSYTQTLQQIQTILQQTQTNLINEKVRMAWQIGKTMNDAGFTSKLITQLSEDLNIGISQLYSMQRFYKAYPIEIPKSKLNWTQYAILSDIKNQDLRSILEKKTVNESLTTRELKEEKKQTEKKNLSVFNPKTVSLTPNRGKLYHYKLNRPYPNAEICLDLGFSVLRTMKLSNLLKELVGMQKGANIVEIVKINNQYAAKKTETKSRGIYTYKGYLTRIVDGDTIRVSIDLGFGIFREEILRLRGVYADEMGTDGGTKAKKFLERILKNIEFVVLRTYKTDMYGRYVCDVFYSKHKKNAQEVADFGTYLNQELVSELS